MQFAMVEPPVVAQLRAAVEVKDSGTGGLRNVQGLQSVPAKDAIAGLKTDSRDGQIVHATPACSILATSNIILRRFSTAITVSQRENKRYVCH
jgi:hypothetical protein